MPRINERNGAPASGQAGITADKIARAAWGHPSGPPRITRSMTLAIVPPLNARSLAIEPADRPGTRHSLVSDPRQLSLPFPR